LEAVKSILSNRRWTVGLVLALCTAILYFVFLKDFVRQSILVPVYYFIWLGGLYLRSFDQALLWGILLVIGLILALNLILKGRRHYQVGELEEITPNRFGRVAHWQTYIKMMQNSYYSENLLADELKRLLLSILAHQYRRTPTEVEEKIQNSEIQLPADIYQFLFDRTPFEVTNSGHFAFFTGWFKRIFKPETPHLLAERQQKLQRVIHYLEDQVSGQK
jgi:hypothetical protein